MIFSEIEDGAALLYEEYRLAHGCLRRWIDLSEYEREPWRLIAQEVERLASTINDEANKRATDAEEALEKVEQALVKCIYSMEEELVPVVKRSRCPDRAEILDRATNALAVARSEVRA